MKTSHGTVLIIAGPESAGKTTLATTILSSYSHWHTINRKKHLQAAVNSANIIEEFFSEIIKDVEQLSGQKITTLNELHSLRTDALTEESRHKITDLISAAVSISNTVKFRERVLSAAYKGYFQDILPIVVTGENVVVDDSTIDSQRAFNLFRASLQGYPHIKLVFLKSTMAGILANCQTRNRKYKRIATDFASYHEVSAVLQQMEIESGGSGFSFRFPKQILRNYHQLYRFKELIGPNDLVIEKISRHDLRANIKAMSNEQNDIVFFLRTKGFIVDRSNESVDVESEINFIMGDASCIYITCKFRPNYLVDLNYSVPKTQYMLREWRLAITSFGKLLILNGVSSSGKSTLAAQGKAIGFNVISFDDTVITHMVRAIFHNCPEFYPIAKHLDFNSFLKVCFGLHVNSVDKNPKITSVVQSVFSDAEFIVKIFDLMWGQAKVNLLRGENVLIDAVLSSDEKIDLFKQRFLNFKSIIALIYTPLEENLLRCFARNLETIADKTINGRAPALIIDQYATFYKSIPKRELLGHQKAIGTLSKDKILDMESAVESNSNLLADYYYPPQSKDHISMLRDTERAISKLKSITKADSNETVFVVPDIKYDTMFTPAFRTVRRIGDRVEPEVEQGIGSTPTILMRISN